jgi:lipopolysaccharide export LptBFGC system permease protein LptF
MKKQFFFVIPVAFIFISSCTVVSNLYPISENENDFIFKKELIGKWGNTKDSSGYYQVDTVEGSNGKLYRATVIGPNEEDKNIMDTMRFLAQLIQVDNKYFIDCQLDIETNFPLKKDDYSSWLLARHFVYTISFNGPDKIELTFPDPDALLQLINDKKLNLNYYTVRKDDYLILNKPAELQAALKESLKYASTVYKEKDVLVRLK